MPEITIDCQNLPCPQPVLECKKLIETHIPSAFSIRVDNEAAKENVTRFVAGKGYGVTSEMTAFGWLLHAVRNESSTAQCACEVMTADQQKALNSPTSRICVFLTADGIGSGDDELGARLMKNFIATLPELGAELWRIVMVNGGVRLAVQGSPVQKELEQLEQAGVSILVCGTCLDFFQLLDARVVGQTTNMLDVVTSLQLASKVIRP